MRVVLWLVVALLCILPALSLTAEKNFCEDDRCFIQGEEYAVRAVSQYYNRPPNPLTIDLTSEYFSVGKFSLTMRNKITNANFTFIELKPVASESTYTYFFIFLNGKPIQNIQTGDVNIEVSRLWENALHTDLVLKRFMENWKTIPLHLKNMDVNDVHYSVEVPDIGTLAITLRSTPKEDLLLPDVIYTLNLDVTPMEVQEDLAQPQTPLDTPLLIQAKNTTNTSSLTGEATPIEEEPIEVVPANDTLNQSLLDQDSLETSKGEGEFEEEPLNDTISEETTSALLGENEQAPEKEMPTVCVWPCMTPQQILVNLLVIVVVGVVLSSIVFFTGVHMKIPGVNSFFLGLHFRRKLHDAHTIAQLDKETAKEMYQEISDMYKGMPGFLKKKFARKALDLHQVIVQAKDLLSQQKDADALKELEKSAEKEMK